MGGRGASSGFSQKGNKYGSQYKPYFTKGNIAFVSKVSRQSESLMETMTKGRIYVVAGDRKLQKIVYFDSDGKRIKEINLDLAHLGMQPHTHHRYFHNENDGPEGATSLSESERKMVEKARRYWYDFLKNRK
ncbi:hypothetical protein [Dubosiella newyorkensis]|uniref:Uncharacterized protein n=1 Tax=Dubosiella newyorkensis TaxID=1862672 RepID=A0A1U7NKI3_9FIRM|nr:hypothetical protein [Dubosiella newyorkensis]OLU44764.1 hypothetical protein BO225_09965 [Dubosiella newyorkensis]